MKSGYTREILLCPASQSTGFHFGKLPTVTQHNLIIKMKIRPINRKLFTTSCLSIIFLFSLNSFAQKDVLELTFTAIDGSDHVQLDSIKVMNRTQGGDTVLYWPDTVLSLYYVGLIEINKYKEAFQIFQNYPNPVVNWTTISLLVPEKDQVSVQVTDPIGRVILKSDKILDKGIHSFRFTPGGGTLYLFTSQWRGNIRSIKILSTLFCSNTISSLEYVGIENYSLPLKTSQVFQSFPFTPDDELLYIGYAASLQSGFLDDPEESQFYSFQFATNIPCPGLPTIEYEGEIYNTIQIFSQCWLKENLNVGINLPDSMEMIDNGIIEKYCYNNSVDSCNKYGGLYMWDEMMEYDFQPGTQGICPPGWHIPAYEEWKVLEGSVDSQYKIGDPEWDISNYWRGFDAGLNLKETSGWHNGGNGNNVYGFSGLPGGYLNCDHQYLTSSEGGLWWLSSWGSIPEHPYYSGIYYLNDDIISDSWNHCFSFSVRCILGN